MASTHPRLTRAVTVLVPVTYALLVFGSTVRANGAGLACPDWPLCFGEVVPALDFGIFLEWGHRTLASLVSLAWVGIGVALLRSPELRARFGLHWGIGLVLLGVQVVLGGLTVLELLAQWTVASHLVGGNLFCLTILLLALRLREHDAPVVRAPAHGAVRLAAVSVAVLVFTQITLGGLVAGSHAGLACGTWPTCNGTEYFPTFSGLIGLQVTHRLTGYMVFSGMLAAVVATGGKGRVGASALVLLALGVVQVTLGIANVMMQMPVEITVLHSAGADAIVLGTAWLGYEAWATPVAAAQHSASLETVEAS